MVDQTGTDQGELVLINPVGQPGANNRPPQAAPTTCHTVTPITANRAVTAAAAARITATASAHTDPAGPGRHPQPIRRMSVADQRDNVVVFALAIARYRHPQRGRQRS